MSPLDKQQERSQIIYHDDTLIHKSTTSCSISAYSARLFKHAWCPLSFMCLSARAKK